MKKKPVECCVDAPAVRQRRYPIPGSDLGESNAIPRDSEYDMRPAYSKTRIGVADEQTFRVTKRGNCP